MPKYRGDMDRSVAFTILLDVMPGYADSVDDDNGRTITHFLNAWYLDPGTDMYAFARTWVTSPTCVHCGRLVEQEGDSLYHADGDRSTFCTPQGSDVTAVAEIKS